MWLLYALITAFCWGIVLASVKRAYDAFSPLSFLIAGSIAALVILLPFALINGGSISSLSLVVVAGIVAALFIFEFYVLEKGKLSLTGTILNTYPLFTLILAMTLLRESPTLLVKFGIFITLGGIILVSLEKVDLRKIKPSSWFWWGLSGAIATGIGDFLIKVMISNYDPYSYSLAFVLGWLFITVLAVILATAKGRKIQMDFHKREALFLFVGAAVLFLGYVFLHLSLKEGLVSVVTPITSTAAVISIFLAFVWLKERILKHQLIGAVFAIIGVILISLA